VGDGDVGFIIRKGEKQDFEEDGLEEWGGLVGEESDDCLEWAQH
jgi:hypothetical protein